MKMTLIPPNGRDVPSGLCFHGPAEGVTARSLCSTLARSLALTMLISSMMSHLQKDVRLEVSYVTVSSG